jgi:hypothetical protein
MIGPLQDHDVSWWAAAFLKRIGGTKSESTRQRNLAPDR